MDLIQLFSQINKKLVHSSVQKGQTRCCCRYLNVITIYQYVSVYSYVLILSSLISVNIYTHNI